MLDARVIDGNDHGMCLVCAEPLPDNQIMDVTVHLPDGPLAVLLASRHVAAVAGGHAIGASIFAATLQEARRWARYCRDAADRAAPPRRGIDVGRA